MSDDRFDIRAMNLRDSFPWLNLFRGFEVARDVKKVALGAIGALLMSVGWVGILKGFGPDLAPPAVAAERLDSVEEDLALARRLPWERPTAPGEVDDFSSPLRRNGWTRDWSGPARLVFEPLYRLALPVLILFHSHGTSAVGLLMLIWTLLVWSICGGAITRIAAVQVARDGQVGLVEAIRFVFGRYFSYLISPVLPVLGVAVIVVFCALGGLLTRVPGLNVFMGVFWFLALIAGFVISIALFGLALGWPLMYSAFGAEATDSFDALSRAYSYVLGRSWRYFFYMVVSLAYGAILMTCVVILGYWLVHLSQYAVAWGGGDSNLKAYYAYVPTAGGWRADFGPEGGELPTGASHWTALFVGFWVHSVLMAILGFAYSYFWSSATIIYFLLRKDVDETEIEEVFMEEEEEEPFPTIAPALGPTIDPPPPTTTTSPILPIVDPPPSQ